MTSSNIIRHNPRTPFNDLPPLPPSADLETREILRDLNTASRALAELKGASRSVPNPQILLDGLAIQEALASSYIENIVTTNQQLYSFLATRSEDADVATKEVARYRPAMLRGIDMLNSRGVLSTEMFRVICSMIKGTEMTLRGDSEKERVFIGNNVTREVVYTPPHGHDVIITLLDNLLDFIHDYNSELDPLIRMAVFHYQFEAIHPFHDGNGRTGRVLNIIYLMQQNLLDHPILYLSRYFQRHRMDYYLMLRTVTRESAWDSWVRFVLRGISEIAEEAREKIDQIRDLRSDFATRARTNARNAASETLLDLIFEHPYCRIEMVQETEQVSRPTAVKYLEALESAGLVQSHRAGRRRLFVNRTLIDILER